MGDTVILSGHQARIVPLRANPPELQMSPELRPDRGAFLTPQNY